MSNQRTHPIPIKKNKLLTTTPSNISPTISPKNSKLKKMYCDIFPGQLQTTTLDNSQKVWAQGYDLYLKLTTGKRFLENDESLINLFSDIEQFSCSKLDEKLEFWTYVFEEIHDVMQKSCEFTVSEEQALFVRKLYHSGIIFLILRNPTYLGSFFKKVDEVLKNTLESDNFWSYNPLRLVTLILWCRSLHNKTLSFCHEKPNSCFDEVIENLPFKELPYVDEQEICEQDLAIDYVDSVINSSTEQHVFIDLLQLVSASILGSSQYDLEDQFSLDQ